jgi:hypothetical protein
MTERINPEIIKVDGHLELTEDLIKDGRVFIRAGYPLAILSTQGEVKFDVERR